LLDHRFSPADQFFRRLENEFYIPGEIIALVRQQFSYGQADSDMTVMAASVHNALGTAFIFGLNLLYNRQRVNVGSVHYSFTWSRPAQHCHNPGFGYPGLNFQTQFLQPLGNNTGRTVLGKSQFRVAVNIAPDGYQVVPVGFRLPLDFSVIHNLLKIL
jgi:hypothetical protein